MAGRNSEVRVAIVADNSSLSSGLQDSQSKLASFGKAVGKVALAAGAAAAVGLAALSKASIEAASDAQQSLGGTQAVFGKFAKQVIRDSNQAALAVGLSANEYRESANIIGALLVNQGLAQDKLRGQTKDLIGTASDLAATFGGTTANAVDALASAFKGEFDPLQNLGITLLQSKVNTEALSVANVKSTAAFNKLSTAQQAAAKRQATVNLINKQAAVASGQFAKQSKTLAEQQQMLGAQWDNLKVKIGNALLPAVTNLFVVLNTDLMPALAKLAKQYLPQVRKALDDWTKSGSPQKMMADLADAVKGIDWGKIGDQLGDLGQSAKELGPALASVGSAGVGDTFKVLGVAMGFAAEHADTLRKVMPLLLAAFAAYKAAQLANNIAGKDSVVGLAAQLYVIRQLRVATDQLANSTRGLSTATAAEATNAGAVAGKVSKLGLAAKGAAGLAGMGALAAGASQSNEALSTLGNVAGGALTGFAVGGPWGAAIGAGAGLLGSLASHLSSAGDAAKEATPEFKTLAGTLDDTTGAVSDLTRATIYQNLASNGTLDALNKLGVSSRTVVSYVLGHKGAQDQLNQVLTEQQRALEPLNAQIAQQREALDAAARATNGRNAAGVQDLAERGKELQALIAERDRRQGVIDSIRREVGELNATRKAKRAEILATQDLSGLYGKLPKRVVTKLDAVGIKPSTKGIAEVAKRFKLLPKQVRAIISVLGIDTTVRQVDKVRDKLKEAGKTKADLGPFKRSIDDQMARFRQSATTGGKSIADNIKRETGKAKADLSPFQRGLQQSLSGAKATASSGGAGVGSSLKSGVLSGVAGLGTELSAQMSSAVNQGIAAARAAAQAKSPSRKTMKLGEDITKGLIVGVQKGASGVTSALQRLSDRTTRILAQQLEQRQRAIRARLKGKAEQKALSNLSKAWRRHSEAVGKATQDERRRLIALGKAQDRVARQLENAKGKLADLTQASLDYAASIKTSFVAFGDITQLGVSEDQGGVNIADLVDQLKQRARDAQRFADLVKRLQAEGLNRDQIEQITQAGVEGGLATAEAIQSAIDAGQTDVIAQINQQSAAIKQAGAELGDALSTRYYRAGIKAAQGLVDGLESQGDKLDRASAKLAKRLVAAIKRALGIKSPSAVFRGIGTDINRGLAIGIADTYATKAASSLASNVVAAFGSPGVASSSQGGAHMTATVTLTAQQLSQLERGRAIQLDLDAYTQAGGRRRA
jgi:hypothetical protein